MFYSPLDELLKHADNNRYILAVIAGKRAHQIIEVEHANDERPDKAVTIAFEEIINGKIKFEKVKTGKK